MALDKGIRAFCDAKFIELLPTRENSRLGNMAFRKSVREAVMEAFGCTGAAASTHYNHSFIEARKKPELAELLQGLGRPEDKKGGRKPKPPIAATTETTPEATPTEGAAETAPTEGAEDGTIEEVPNPNGWDSKLVPPTYSVRKKDGTVIASGLTQEQAQELIEKAKKAKKGAMEMEAETAPESTAQEPQPEAETPAETPTAEEPEPQQDADPVL